MLENNEKGIDFNYPDSLFPNQKGLLKAFHITGSFGHSGSIDSVITTSDGKYIVSGSSDQTIKVWELSSGKILRMFSGHSGMVRKIILTSDNKYLVSCAYDRTIFIWNFETTEVVKRIVCESPQEEKNELTFITVALSPDERYIVSGCSAELNRDLNSLQIWEFPSGKLLHTVRVGEEEPRIIAITKDNRYIIVQCGYDPTIYVWELNTGRYVRTFNDIHRGVEQIIMSHDGKHAYTSSTFGTINQWEIENGNLVKTIHADDKKITDIRETIDTKYLISCSSGMIPKEKIRENPLIFEEGSIKVWDLSNFSCILTINDKKNGDSFSSIAITPDAKYIVSGDSYNNSLIRVWDLKTGELAQMIKGSRHVEISSIVILPDKKTCIFTTNQPFIHVIDIETGTLVKKFKAHDDLVWEVALTPDGKFLASISRDHSIKIWDPESFTLLYTIDQFTFHQHVVSSPRSHLGAAPSSEGVKLVDFKQGTVSETEIYQEDLSSIGFTPGENIITGSYEDHIKIWDKDTGTLIRSIRERSTGATSVAVSPDGKYIFGNPEWSDLYMWDYNSGELLQIFKEHKGIIDKMVYSNDNNYFASASSDGQIRVWDFQQGICYGPFRHSRRIKALTFLGNEDIIIGGDENSDIKVWEFKKGPISPIAIKEIEEQKSKDIQRDDFKSDEFTRFIDMKYKEEKYEEVDVVDYWYHRGWQDSVMFCSTKFGTAFKEFLDENRLDSPKYYKDLIKRIEFMPKEPTMLGQPHERKIDLADLTKHTPEQDLFEKLQGIFTEHTEKELPYEDLGKLLGVPELMRSTMERRDNIIYNLFSLFFKDISSILQKSFSTIENKEKIEIVRGIILKLVEDLKNNIKSW